MTVALALPGVVFEGPSINSTLFLFTLSCLCSSPSRHHWDWEEWFPEGGTDRAMSRAMPAWSRAVGAKGSLERLLMLPGAHSHLVCNGTTAAASKSPVKVGLYYFSSHSS